jgi:hypothetical protein
LKIKLSLLETEKKTQGYKKDGGREQRDAHTNQGTPRIAGTTPPEAERVAQDGFCLRSSRRNQPGNALILDFWIPNL